MKAKLLLLAICLAPITADADHRIVHEPYDLLIPRSTVGITVETIHFSREDAAGEGLITTPFMRWAPLPAFSLETRVPYVSIQPTRLADDLLDPPAAQGVGDVSLIAATAYALNSQHFFGVSLPVIIPTGDVEKGLGAGHFELEQALLHRFRVDRLSLRTVVSHSLSLGHDHHTPTVHTHSDNTDHVHPGKGSLLTPHANQEIRAQIGLLLNVERGFASIDLESTYTLDPDVAFGGLTPTIGGGLFASDDLVFHVEVGVPVAGDNRYLWRTLFGLSYYWDTRPGLEPTPHEDDSGEACGCSQ